MTSAKETVTGAVSGEETVEVGGAPMYPSRNIVENAVNSKDHTTLVAAVQAADLVETLESPGPFTVFAPTNAAFDALPAGAVDTLLEPENKPQLQKVLTYHVVPAAVTSADLRTMIVDDGGRHAITTVSGGTLYASQQDGKIMIEDEMGHVGTVTIADVYQSNGVIHVIDTVMLPEN
ncbi:MAG: fasciclin domain-containing protein [Geminicoccaceae bacterium]|nr:fasciclin domain-containing protein [Geminicoccaceae bacterium]